MPVSHKEVAFEAAIEDALLGRGYQMGDPAGFDRGRCLDPGVLLAFIEGNYSPTHAGRRGPLDGTGRKPYRQGE